MKKYKVRSGQNIYDVALTLYGSVEGVFDLLASNRDISMETRLHYGMELNYHDELVINKSLVMWLNDNGIIVKNGDREYGYTDMEKIIQDKFIENHPEMEEYLNGMSEDERNMFWETQYTPRMIIKQKGSLSTVKFQLKKEKHLFIDWGDTTPIQVFEEDSEQEVEHCYKGDGVHKIVLYGDFRFSMLDFTELNGIYYPLNEIYAERFYTSLNENKNNQLIITMQ